MATRNTIPASGRFPGGGSASSAPRGRSRLVVRPKVTALARGQALALAQAQSRIRELQRAVAAGDRRLLAQQQADQRKNHFIATLSHELRTPLHSLLALSDLLRAELAGPLMGEQRQYVDVIHRSGQRLLGLANSVLDLARIESGQTALDLGDHDVRGLLTAVGAVVGPLAEDKGLSLVVDLPRDLPIVRCNPAAVEQVMTNLLGNAIKFTEAGTVTLGCRTAGGLVELSVSDTGVGIPVAARQRIFDEFFQVDESVGRRKGGSGLGLAIVRRLVRLMNGRVAVDSAVGGGSRFVVELPRGKPPVAAPRPVSSPVRRGRAGQPKRRSERGAHSPRR